MILGVFLGCVGLGVLYYKEQNYKKAYKYSKIACDGKNEFGCSFLAALYRNGEGVKQNYKKTKKYFGKACNLGHQKSCEEYKKLN